MYFSDVLSKTMHDNLQDICLSNHEIEILVLQDKMRKMHNKWDTILKYIEALEDAQQQAKSANMPINDATLVMYASRAILSTEKYPNANDLWEDLDRVDRTWKEWKSTYTKADRKATAKRMVSDNVEQFSGAATGGACGNGGGSGGGTKPPAVRPSPVTLDEL